MTKITINLPDDMKLGTKVNGQWLDLDVTKLHETWVTELLRYGVQRKLNDMFAGEKGQTKWEMVRAQIADMQRGESKPVRVATGRTSTADPVRTMARKLGKETLLAAFKAHTQMAKITDMCEASPKIAQFFTITDDRAVWNHSKLDEWMESKPGGRDFMAEAEAATSVDLGDLGL